MAQMVETKVREFQAEQLQTLDEELHICGICKKSKHLYVCKFNGCPQRNRLLCKKCGLYTHDDEDDDIDHVFDIAREHVRHVAHSLTLSDEQAAQNRSILKRNAREIHLMAAHMKEEKVSQDRNTFFTAVSHLPRAIDCLQGIKEYVTNEQYFMDAFSEMSSSIRGGSLKTFSSQFRTVLYDVGDWSLEATKVCKEGAVVAACVLFAAEVGFHTYRWIKGDITLKTLGRKMMSASALATGAAIGNVGGGAVGASIGTLLFPFIGTAVGGALGSLFGAIFVGLALKKSVEDIPWFNERNEQEVRRQLIKEALDAFGFDWADLTNQDVFNEAAIAKKYRTRAKETHPDRPAGTDEKFHKLNTQMTILLAVLHQDEAIKNETSEKIEAMSITL